MQRGIWEQALSCLTILADTLAATRSTESFARWDVEEARYGSQNAK